MNYDLRTVSVDALLPWEKNPRHNDEAAERVAASIARFGFAAPVIVQKATGVLIAGHTRLKAAKKLGITEVPAIYVDVDDASAAALAIADNKLGELATWDEEMLKELLSEVIPVDDYAIMGFEDEEIERLLRETADIEAHEDVPKTEEETGRDIPDLEECTICIGDVPGNFRTHYRFAGTGTAAVEPGYVQLLIRKGQPKVTDGLLVKGQVSVVAVYGEWIAPSNATDYYGTMTDAEFWKRVLPACAGDALLIKAANASEIARAAADVGYRVRCE